MTGASSGLQVVVRGIPWSYTWRELKDMFNEIGDLDRADVVYGEDGRSRVSGAGRCRRGEEQGRQMGNRGDRGRGGSCRSPAP